MKNKIKLLFIILALFLFTGCSANYNIEIYNDEVKVNGKILEEKDKWDSEVKLPHSNMPESDVPDVYKDLQNSKYTYTYRELVDSQFNLDDTVEPLKGLSKISNLWQLGLKFKRNYKLYGKEEKSNSFINTAGATLCYDNFNVTENEEDNTLVISTSSANKCFTMYPNLDKITVKVKTNHKVVDSTADEVSKHTFIWNITKNDSKDKPLQITLKNDEYVFNYDNRILKIIGIAFIITISIVILGKIGIIIYNFRVKRRNKI